MQDVVTGRVFKKRHKINFMPVLSFILIVVFSCILVASLVIKKSNKIFEEKSFFFVSATKSRKQNELASSKDLVETLGGAGYVLENKGNFYLTVNVYSNKTDANEISSSINSAFASSEIVELKSSALSKQKQILIRQNEAILNFIKFYDKFIDDFLEMELNYLAGKITSSNLTKEIISKKLILQEYETKFCEIEQTDIVQSAKVVISLVLTHLDNFLLKFFESTKKNSILCLLAVNLAIVRVEMFDYL